MMGTRGTDPFEMDFDTAVTLAAVRVATFGRYSLSRYPQGAWEFSDSALGSTGRGPVRAFIRWVRWRREYNSKPPGYWASE